MSRAVLVADWKIYNDHRCTIFVDSMADFPRSNWFRDLTLRRNYLKDNKLVFEVAMFQDLRVIGNEKKRLQNGDSIVAIDATYESIRFPASYTKLGETEEHAAALSSNKEMRDRRNKMKSVHPMFIVSMW